MNKKKDNEKAVITYVDRLELEHLKHWLLDVNWTFKKFVNVCIAGASYDSNIKSAIIEYYSSSLDNKKE